MGIVLPGELTLNAIADAGVDPPAPNFVAASDQSYTVSVDAPGTAAQSITMTLYGAPASSFEALVGETLTPLSASGTFSVTIPAGSTSAAFSLINVGNVANGAALQLTASMPDLASPSSPAISSQTLTFPYLTTGLDNPFQEPLPTTLIWNNGHWRRFDI